MKTKNKFRALSILLSLCMMFSTLAYAESDTASYLKLYINNEEMIFENPMIVSGNEVLVPLREMIELFGGSIEWMPDSQIAICSAGAHKMVVQSGRSTGKIDATIVDITPAPYIAGGSMFVPLSFVCKALNLSYSYDAVGNAANVAQNPEVASFPLTHETYLTKSAEGVYSAIHNKAAKYQKLNTRSSGATGEMFYEIDIKDVPKEFKNANLVIPSAKINARGTFIVSEVISGMDGNRFGTLDFSQGDTIVLTESDKTPVISETPIAEAASDLVVSLDLTDYVKQAVSEGREALYLHIDYKTGSVKTANDGARVNTRGSSAGAPHLEIVSEPDYVEIPDLSHVKFAYTKNPATESERVLYTNGIRSSVIKNSANAGYRLNTLSVRSATTSEITYTFSGDSVGTVKNATITLSARATAAGVLTISNAAGKAAFVNIPASGEYSNISADVTQLLDSLSGTLELKMAYTPNEGADGDMYICSINSENAPTLAITSRIANE